MEERAQASEGMENGRRGNGGSFKTGGGDSMSQSCEELRRMGNIESTERNFPQLGQPGTPKRKQREGSVGKDEKVTKKGKERGESLEEMETEEESEEGEEWMEGNEKKLWKLMLKKYERWYDVVMKECNAIVQEAREDAEREKKEKDAIIKELKDRIEVLEGAQVGLWAQGGGNAEGEGETGAEGAGRDNNAWNRVVRRKVKENVLEVMNDNKVKRKLARVAEEVKEQKDKERNVIVKGWRSVMREGEALDERTVTRAVLGRAMKLNVEIEEVQWYGKDEERKVLMVKLKSREDKREVMVNKKRLKGTKVFVDDDIPREEREVTQKLMALKAKLKGKNKDMDVWVSRRQIKVDGEWYTWEEVQRREGNF